MFVPHASEIWTKSFGPNYTNFELFDKKPVFLNHFGQSVDAILEDVLVAETMFNVKLLISRLPSSGVPKITIVWHV